MADTKLSALTSAGSVGDSDLLYLVQGSESRKVTASLLKDYALYSVKNYGAIGNGTTNDTTAITAAITAIPSSGGVLYFPPGTYVTSGGFTLSNPTMVMGCGKAGYDGSSGAISAITCTSATANLFNVTASNARFENLALINTAAGTPSAGAGIVVTVGTALDRRVDYESISVKGFYYNINSLGGCGWTMRNCWLVGPVKYGLRILNTASSDEGDWSISDCGIFAVTYDSDAAIRIQQSGGGKIQNIKINMSHDSKKFLYGIDFSPTSASTVILLLSNNSIENTRSSGFIANVPDNNWDEIIINGNQFSAVGTSIPAISITGDASHTYDRLIITGNIFKADSGTAVTLTYVNNAVIGGNVLSGYGTILSEANCTGVVTY